MRSLDCTRDVHIHTHTHTHSKTAAVLLTDMTDVCVVICVFCLSVSVCVPLCEIGLTLCDLIKHLCRLNDVRSVSCMV
jgi:hypothetical protein